MALTGIKKLFGGRNERYIKGLQPLVDTINGLEEEMKALKPEQFPKETQKLKDRLTAGDTLNELLPRAFALVREASHRTLGQRHYDVQLIGGIVLHQGKIAEMRTGEGKTLVATLPAYLNALTGDGVHVVTVNDYLSRRDASWMGQIYQYLGLSVGVINSQNVSYIYDEGHTDKKDDAERDEEGSFKVEYEFLKPAERKAAYAADITYGTNNEFGFDYLRDNLVSALPQLVQRVHNYAIVDEIDSILIDEARTPLIIAGEAGDSEKLYTLFAGIARTLKVEEDYTVDEKLRATSLSDAGITHAESLLGIDNIYTEKGIKYVHHLETAVRAQSLYLRDRDYVVQNGEVIIVDPFTGRMQPGRRWNEGLHQAVEAKEGVRIQRETRAIASITFQNYFKLYKKLGGMTGTADTSSEEFLKVYNLDVIVIPTHRTINRIDHNDLIYQTEKAKFKAVAKKVKELYDKGQPVLIGTVSIEKNELLAAYLAQEGLPHTVLNAKNHEREGEIIAQAGKQGSVVVATNMAGRGIDIALGGKPTTSEATEKIKSAGGLFVLGTERHEARRIDNQLRGRAGRQGDPGETQFYVSLEDDLMRVFGSDNLKNIMAKLKMPEDMPIESKIITRSLENAQEKIEGFNFDSRKHTLEYDDVMNYQRTAIYGRRRKMLEAKPEDIITVYQEIMSYFPEKAGEIEAKRKEIGEETFLETVRRIILHVTDLLWTEHIETMDYTRSSVNLRAYGQRDPLIEYKREGLRLFKEMEEEFRNQVLTLMVSINQNQAATTADTSLPLRVVASHESAPLIGQGADTASQTSNPNDPYAEQKIGRNDLCPCGSGKKYKKCHGA